MLARVVAVVALLVGGGAQAQAPTGPQQWLCVADASIGFSFDKATKAWETTRFKIADSKYVVRRPTDQEKTRFNAAWVVPQMGERVPSVACRADFDDDEIQCGGLTRFTFNRKTLRPAACGSQSRRPQSPPLPDSASAVPWSEC